jgi:hypothetical protein
MGVAPGRLVQGFQSVAGDTGNGASCPWFPAEARNLELHPVKSQLADGSKPHTPVEDKRWKMKVYKDKENFHR